MDTLESIIKLNQKNIKIRFESNDGFIHIHAWGPEPWAQIVKTGYYGCKSIPINNLLIENTRNFLSKLIESKEPWNYRFWNGVP